MAEKGRDKFGVRQQQKARSNVDQDEVGYEPTFKMKPDKNFNTKEVKGVLLETMASSLNDKKYEASECRTQCKSLSKSICEKVKLLGYQRYKILCKVTIGEKKGQGIRIASRCLWDAKSDGWVDAVYETPEMFAVAVVYGVYLE